jgi:sugar/nucleoside kinase (ribokinase family)
MRQVDYLVIGHASKDITPDGPRLGGTVMFSALLAKALGLQVGVLTSVPDDMLPLLHPLAGIPIVSIPTEKATSFENRYTSKGRVQMLYSRATPIGVDHVPPEWLSAPIVHLAPIADEVSPDLVQLFAKSLIGVTPQGWLRQWDEDGRVSYRPWVESAPVLSHVDATILSIEDVHHDEDMIEALAAQTNVQVVTRGAEGSTLYIQGQPQLIPAAAKAERDPTGAGDIYAAAFFSHLHATGDPVKAAHFATHLASDSVTRAGMNGIPDRKTIDLALAAVRKKFE